MASFDLNALNGINAASQGLATISNNLANAQTVGFKSSRAEFADMFSGSQHSPGNGVRVEAYTQDFGQGTIQGTGRDLDYAIDGEGFFVLEDQSGKYPNVYTRNGSFKLDDEGYITDQSGNKLQGYLLNPEISTENVPVFDTTLSSIDLDALNKTPQATSEMKYDINLDGEEDNNVDGAVPSLSVGVSANLALLTNTDGLTSYGGFPDFSTNKIIHDSLGGEHRLTGNFFKRDVVTAALSDVGQNPDGTYITDGTGTGVKYTSWIVQYTVQDFDEVSQKFVTSGHTQSTTANLGTGDEGMLFELRFDTNGALIDVREPVGSAVAPGANFAPTGQAVANSPLAFASWQSSGNDVTMGWVIDTPLTGATDPLGKTGVNINVDFDEMTQFAGSYNLRGVSQDGFKIGDLVGLNTGLDGVIEARYSNGRSVAVAQIGMANFTDKNAMEKLGGQTYAESFGSGTVQLGTPQNNGFGVIQGGSLEYSNVDTTGELVNMIQTQRTYQASAQVISTSQQLFQTVLNL